MNTPISLTPERALSLLPTYQVAPEWQRKHDADELPEGIEGIRGMIEAVWPDERMTREEADYVLWLAAQGSMRWLAERIVEDDNQIYGSDLIAAAKRCIEPERMEVSIDG